MVRFDLGPLLQGQTRIAKFKIADNLLIIGPRGLQCEHTKSAYNSLIIGPRGLQCETNL